MTVEPSGLADRQSDAQVAGELKKPDRFLLFVLILGALTAFGPLSIDMYLPALPAIAAEFAVPLSTVQLSLASFFIGLALGQLLYGPFTDRFGRKLPLYIGLLIYALASVVCARTASSEALIVARFFQALGSCAGAVISRAVVRDLFSSQHSARVFSLLMLVMGIAPILAPLAGGYVSEAFGWRAIFWVLAGFSTACLAAVALLLPETRKQHQRVHSKTGIFRTYYEILCDRKFLGAAVCGGISQAGMFAYITGSPFVFIDLFHVRPENYGWFFGSNAFALITISQINSRLLRTKTLESILRGAFVLLSIAAACLLASSLLNLGFWPIAISLFAYVGILGMTMPNTSAAALAGEGARAGSASALLGTLQFTIAALASGAVSALHNGTSVPMAAVISACGFSSLVVSRMTFKKPQLSTAT